MPNKVWKFLEANRVSPVEYFSASGPHVTLRLVNGQRFDMRAREFAEIETINWLHRQSSSESPINDRR